VVLEIFLGSLKQWTGGSLLRFLYARCSTCKQAGFDPAKGHLGVGETKSSWKSQPEQNPQTILGFNAVLQGAHSGWNLHSQVHIMRMRMHAIADANMQAR